jgi:8-oxo-dGTP pyrophosphatase MutT (NUDIX family)
LASGLPGAEAQNGMSPEFRGSYEHEREPVQAAVLVLMYPVGEEIFLVFIKRNDDGGPHSAQVSFPGGAREPGDPTLEDTAIRETREELGITGPLPVLGRLTPLHIPISNFLVTPFVCLMDRRPDFRPDPTEVQYVIETSLSHLLDPVSVKWDTWQHHSRTIRAPYFSVGKDRIWGATAMILGEFLQLAGRTL